MSLLSPFKKKSALKKAMQQTALARKSDVDNADKLFRSAYSHYRIVIENEPLIADSLYHWGFALFHQAQMKTAKEADKLYRNASDKFAFCLTLSPTYLGAAIDWGVTLMEQARANNAPATHDLYTAAKEKFLLAENIHKGSATYNIACIHAIRNEADDCKIALEISKDYGSLPAVENIIDDADLNNVSQLGWFQTFIEDLIEQQEDNINPDEEIAVNPQTETSKKQEELTTEEIEPIKQTISPENKEPIVIKAPSITK